MPPLHWYFNPRAPCGARPERLWPFRRLLKISIHAPLAGRDADLRVEFQSSAFQSTRPLRGATWRSSGGFMTSQISIHAPLAGRDAFPNHRSPAFSAFQSTRPLRGATPPFGHILPHPPISIHAPLAGRDDNQNSHNPYQDISIHAPLAGRDRQQGDGDGVGVDFNPRAPCGARLRRSL